MFLPFVSSPFLILDYKLLYVAFIYLDLCQELKFFYNYLSVRLGWGFARLVKKSEKNGP